jgi:hypothetical protein
LPASKERINKAGDILRSAAEQRQRPNDAHREALALVRAYRAAHSYPLTAVTAGLRHHARKAAGDSRLDLSQRLKQLATITDKLVRMPKSRLARMQDIGGCRATFKAAGLGLKSGRAEEWAIDAVASAAVDMRRYELGEVDRAQLVRDLNSSLEPILDLAGGATIA